MVGIVVTHIDMFRIVGKINKIEKLSFQIFLLIQIFKKSKGFKFFASLNEQFLLRFLKKVKIVPGLITGVQCQNKIID